MELPGGLIESFEHQSDDNRLFKTFAFKEVTGAIELALANNRHLHTLMNRVTTTLVHTLEQVGGQPPSRERVLNLSVGDRQFLIRQLANQLNLDAVWLTTECHCCSKPFDVFVRQSELPVKSAGQGYPLTDVNTSQGKLTLRVPTGKDQELINSAYHDEDNIKILVTQLIVNPDAAAPTLNLTPEDFSIIEQALEAIAPEVTTEMVTECPECATRHHLGINPYLCLDMIDDSIFADIHTLASTYHWSEQDILALPRSRRHMYLRLIHNSQGVHDQRTMLPTM